MTRFSQAPDKGLELVLQKIDNKYFSKTDEKLCKSTSW